MTMWLSRSALVLALGSAAIAILAGFGSRLGWWHFSTGFKILTGAAYGGLGSAILGFVGCVAALWRGQRRGAWLALVGLTIGLVVVGVPWQMKRTAQRVPPIHDITTDTDDPPRFADILPLRKDAPNSADYGGPDLAAQQQAAYPDIQPVMLRMPGQEAFTQALKAADAMGWDIVAANPEEGRIEATDTTRWFGFKDDIVIRIQAQGDESRIDVRSVSRVGKSDVGTNARRIRAYVRRLSGAGSTSENRRNTT
jgi:uncharacterized protein (DUF1499 family)